MLESRSDTMVKVHLNTKWYFTYDKKETAIEHIEEWELMIHSDEYMEAIYHNTWLKLNEWNKEDLKERCSWHMKNIILRAQNLQINDFPVQFNKWYNPR